MSAVVRVTCLPRLRLGRPHAPQCAAARLGAAPPALLLPRWVHGSLACGAADTQPPHPVPPLLRSCRGVPPAAAHGQHPERRVGSAHVAAATRAQAQPPSTHSCKRGGVVGGGCGGSGALRVGGVCVCWWAVVVGGDSAAVGGGGACVCCGNASTAARRQNHTASLSLTCACRGCRCLMRQWQGQIDGPPGLHHPGLQPIGSDWRQYCRRVEHG